MTQLIALISLGLFIVVMIAVGIISRSKAATMEGFLLGGRGIGPWISAFAYGTSYFSAVIFIGYAGMHGWNIGMASIWIGVGNALVGCWLAWKVLARPTRNMTHRLRAATTPQFLAARFQSKGMKIYAACVIFIFLVPYTASIYKGLGTMFSNIFNGADPVICMVIVATLTAIYLVLGGYVATSLNDFIQGIIMIAGVFLMMMIVVSRPEVGGLSAGLEKLTAIDPGLVDITGGSNLQFLLNNILLTSLGVWGLPQMVHKYYAIKGESDIKVAAVVSTIFAMIIGCGAYFVGSFSRLFIPADSSGMPALAGGYDEVMPTLLMNALTGSVFTNIVLAIIMLSLLSASMSTLSAVVLSSSSAVAVDLLEEVRPQTTVRKQMLFLRVLCLLFVLMSFIFATLNISFIVNLMSFSWGVVAGSFIGPYLWGLYSKKVTKAGAWAGTLSGVVVVGGALIFMTLTRGFEVAKSFAPEYGVAAMAVSVLIVPLVSRFTKPYKEEDILPMFEKEEEAQIKD